MNWWNILKNTKLSGKAKGKGTSFDASKIKINIDKDDCCEELWLKMQNFINDNLIVISSLRRLNSAPNYGFKGIGHRVFENQTKIFPSTSEKPCEDTADVYLQLVDYHVNIQSSLNSDNLRGMILPFELKHYENSEYPAKDVKEWNQLKDSFYHEWNYLHISIDKCPDVIAAIREREDDFS